MYQKDFSISTSGQGLIEITNQIEEIVAQSSTNQGLCNVFIKHTSASLLIQENASSDVLADLNNFFNSLFQNLATISIVLKAPMISQPI